MRLLASALAPSPASLIMRCVGEHHPQRLIIHLPHYVIHAPARRVCYLPHYPEGAMAPDILGR